MWVLQYAALCVNLQACNEWGVGMALLGDAAPLVTTSINNKKDGIQ